MNEQQIRKLIQEELATMEVLFLSRKEKEPGEDEPRIFGKLVRSKESNKAT